MSNRKVLVVEDDDNMRLVYSAFLKANHYDTVLAADGLFAISEAVSHRPDLIILDLGLPAGDGFTVLERLRASTHLATIPVIVVSSYDVHGNKDRALKAGAQAFLQKPWNDKELLRTIDKLLGQRPPEPPISQPFY